MLKTATVEERQQRYEQSSAALSRFIILASALLVTTGCDSNLAYRAQYPSARAEDIKVQSKPIDCDWDYAPLGRKGCHYEKRVVVIKHSISTQNLPIVSYDDGKTWTVEDRTGTSHAANERYEEVSVTWEKVQDNQ
jgi:hypothetical protein